MPMLIARSGLHESKGAGQGEGKPQPQEKEVVDLAAEGTQPETEPEVDEYEPEPEAELPPPEIKKTPPKEWVPADNGKSSSMKGKPWEWGQAKVMESGGGADKLAQCVEYTWPDILAFMDEYPDHVRPAWNNSIRAGRENIHRIEKAARIALEYINADMTNRNRAEWGMVGDGIDVGAYMSGVPEHMVTMIRKPAKNRGKLFNITANVTDGGGAVRRVMAASLMAYALTMKGAQVRLSVIDNARVQTTNKGLMFSTFHPDETVSFTYSQSLLLKDYTEGFPMERVATFCYGAILYAMFTIQDVDKRLWNSRKGMKGADYGGCANTPKQYAGDVAFNTHEPAWRAAMVKCIGEKPTAEILRIISET